MPKFKVYKNRWFMYWQYPNDDDNTVIHYDFKSRKDARDYKKSLITAKCTNIIGPIKYVRF